MYTCLLSAVLTERVGLFGGSFLWSHTTDQVLATEVTQSIARERVNLAMMTVSVVLNEFRHVRRA